MKVREIIKEVKMEKIAMGQPMRVCQQRRTYEMLRRKRIGQKQYSERRRKRKRKRKLKKKKKRVERAQGGL
jgi:hypothetical protein